MCRRGGLLRSARAEAATLCVAAAPSFRRLPTELQARLCPSGLRGWTQVPLARTLELHRRQTRRPGATRQVTAWQPQGSAAARRLYQAKRASRNDTVSERLRRWTRNPLGSARRGSNPLGVALTPLAAAAMRNACEASPDRTRVRSISGLAAEYIVAIDVTWVRFPADAFPCCRTLALSIGPRGR